MLQVNNTTLFKHSLGVFPNPDGVECAYGVLKATFDMEPGGVRLAKEQLPLRLVDEFLGEPMSSSLKRAGEVSLTKPSTDVLLHGHAYARGGSATTSDVFLRVGDLQKTIRVFGDRIWDSGLFGMKITSPKPFEKIPLRYEYAFGGTDPEPEEESKIEIEARNPVGRGLLPRRSKADWKGVPLPNLEDPRELVSGPKDRPVPACFGPVCGHWAPRKSYVGTYDEAWTKKRAPYLPIDFDSRFFQVAPPDQVSAKYLQGDEPVEIVGATPGLPLRFQLPRCSVKMIFHLDNREHEHVPSLDTITFEPDEKRFTLVWRACQVLDKKVHQLRELELQCLEYSAKKAGAET